MNKFTHITVTSIEQALPFLAQGAQPLAGGTDMLTRLKDGLASPERLLSLRELDELRGMQRRDDGTLWIGARTTLTELERETAIAGGPYRALAQAAHSAASPQLRNVATIGGNMLQESRCWYYRSATPCWLKGGDSCPARSGDHQAHALFDTSPCVTVHPSDPATALLALGGSVLVQSAAGRATLELSQLLVAPTAERRRLTTLASDALLLGIALPALDGWHSIYLKAMQRATYAFALASVAVALRLEAGCVAEARIALGGVATTPWLVGAAASTLIGQPLTAASIAAASELAVADARPLPQTAYKATLIRQLLSAALQQLA